MTESVFVGPCSLSFGKQISFRSSDNPLTLTLREFFSEKFLLIPDLTLRADPPFFRSIPISMALTLNRRQVVLGSSRILQAAPKYHYSPSHLNSSPLSAAFTRHRYLLQVFRNPDPGQIAVKVTLIIRFTLVASALMGLRVTSHVFIVCRNTWWPVSPTSPSFFSLGERAHMALEDYVG